MSLQLVVVSATNVPNVETFGKSDPYASIEFKGVKKKTQVKKEDLDPVWNESFDFDLGGVALASTDELVVNVKDWERVGRNRVLGTARVPLRDLLRGGPQKIELNLDLMDSNGRPLQSKISLKVNYNPPAGSTKGSDISDGGGRVIGDETDDDLGDEDDYDDAGDGGEEQIDAATGQPIKRKRTKKRKLGSRKSRGKLSSKPQDFQPLGSKQDVFILSREESQVTREIPPSDQLRTTVILSLN